MDYAYTLELYQALQYELEETLDEQDLLDRLSRSLGQVRLKLNVLENYIKLNPPSDTPQEILYFKKVYPLFKSQLIYYTESYNLERSLRLVSKPEQLSYLREEVKAISRFFKKNSSLYEYHKLSLSELDAMYFSEAAPAKNHLLPELPMVGSATAPASSYIMAKIIALEKLGDDIEKKLYDLEMPRNPADLKPARSKLKWTGDAINLVEVAYGIWLTGQLNNGNASVTEIIEFLESRLDVKIGRPYRRWTEISRRKALSPTKYIDQMKRALDNRIDEEHRLK